MFHQGQGADDGYDLTCSTQNCPSADPNVLLQSDTQLVSNSRKHKILSCGAQPKVEQDHNI